MPIQDSIVIQPKTAYLFDPKSNGAGLTELDISKVSGFNNTISAAYADPVTDRLYFVHSLNSLAVWNNDPGALLPYDYTTRLLFSPYPSNFFYAELRGPGISNTTFSLVADGTTIYTVTRSSQGEFVLPEPTQSCREWKFRLQGTDTIEYAEVAEEVEELS